MFAPNYKTAEELKIDDETHSKLIGFVRLENAPDFEMDNCLRCAMGTAFYGTDYSRRSSPVLNAHEMKMASYWHRHPVLGLIYNGPSDATFRQAQSAVRNALTFGDPMWSEVIGKNIPSE